MNHCVRFSNLGLTLSCQETTDVLPNRNIASSYRLIQVSMYWETLWKKTFLSNSLAIGIWHFLSHFSAQQYVKSNLLYKTTQLTLVFHSLSILFICLNLSRYSVVFFPSLAKMNSFKIWHLIEVTAFLLDVSKNTQDTFL